MLISPACIPCIIKQSYTLSRLLGVEDKNLQSKIIYETMELLIEVKDFPTAPQFSEKLQSLIKQNLNGSISLKEIKERNLKIAEKYIKYLRTMVEASTDKLETAVRISIIGNTIDLGANPNFNLEKEINTLTSDKINLNSLKLFREDLKKANLILYIADNYEEALFDKILLEQLLPKEIVFAVRSAEILNDITLEDAKSLGIDKMCKVIESGSKISGTAMEQVSNEFLDYFNKADLVIAKGQGNFETLLNSKRKIYFMFKIKCEPIAELCGYPEGMGILYTNN
jgi:damage-control phosphatase, subfamily I